MDKQDTALALPALNEYWNECDGVQILRVELIGWSCIQTFMGEKTVASFTVIRLDDVVNDGKAEIQFQVLGFKDKRASWAGPWAFVTLTDLNEYYGEG